VDLPPLDVVSILKDHQIWLKKSLGQNFLVSPAALERIVEAAQIAPGDRVLEVGAGVGSLTRQLAVRAGRVVAVELDRRLMEPLHEVLEPFQNVQLVQGDILELDVATLMEKSGYRVVSNIPYYITSALIRHLLEADAKPFSLVLTLQREVAERICAAPGDLSLLALSVQVYGEPAIVARIPAEAFYPRPKVDSRVVRVAVFPTPRVDGASREVFFRLAQAGFSQRRKTLRNALSSGLAWTKTQTEEICRRAGIDPGRRAETLAIEEWIAMAEDVRSTGS
jgi:16S rRNA (adenine1518-N6/adenine1519-N6)-dimethyltransferase